MLAHMFDSSRNEFPGAADRIEIACAMVTQHPELATAITLCGLKRDTATAAAIQAAEREYGVQIVMHSASDALSVTVEVLPPPEPLAASPVSKPFVAWFPRLITRWTRRQPAPTGKEPL